MIGNIIGVIVVLFILFFSLGGMLHACLRQERKIAFFVDDRKIYWLYEIDTPPELPIVEKEGYIFLGWFVDEPRLIPCDENNIRNADTLYAKFKSKIENN